MSQQKKGPLGPGGGWIGRGGTDDARFIRPDGRSQMPVSGIIPGNIPRLDSPMTPTSPLTAQNTSIDSFPPLPPPPPPLRRGLSSHSPRGQFASPTRETFSTHASKRRKPPLASSSATPGGRHSGRPESDVLGPYHSDGSHSDFGSEENCHHGEEPTLVRQASVGKMGRPSLRTIGQRHLPEKTGSRGEGLSPTSSSYSVFSQSLPAHSDGLPGLQPAPNYPDWTSPVYGRGVYPGRSQNNSQSSALRAPSPVGRELESRTSTPNSGTQGGRSDLRRPQNRNLDGDDIRASQTSLPELIRRATKLASNLDRGKTASRVGILDMLNGSRSASSPLNRRSGSISDILASFPSPRITPNSELRSSWPLHSKETGGDFKSAFSPNPTTCPSKQKRQLCGMPLLCFIVLCFLVLLLILTAIIVPIMFFVIRRNPTPQASSTPWGTCQDSTPCMNGGISIQPDNVCACLCVEGFSGSQCTVSGDTSCSTTDISNGTSGNQNVTLGNALPRLFNISNTDFGIPLDQSDILALFSVNTVSCTNQNSLVTFNGVRAVRRSPRSHFEYPILPPEPTERPAVGDGNDDESGRGIFARQEAIATANNIVFEPSQPLSSTLTSTNTSPTTTQMASSTSSPSVPRRVLDFSSIAILFIFEQTNTISAASAAQTQIQSFLTNMSANLYALNTTGNFILNFVDFTIALSNGTTVGGVHS
ncbi:hypothetical protein Egran_05918 [Elaphomyces granulatus]|uniref:EGF-like domain-containing protein n=1 Tax=Elaphomyces granulatus TaxID=519963 RepID=A0A232LQ67_9EURO|nr:hypothetical protein Egran_05918 [Elaphomyces granulatus]